MDLIATLRSQANCPHVDPKSAIKMLKRANKLEMYGNVDNRADDQAAAKAWEKRFGMAPDSAEAQEAAYKAVEAMRRKELEAKAKQEQRQARHGRRKR